MKNQIAISRRLANRCAEALVAKHNAIPHDDDHDAIVLCSYRDLYRDLRALGVEFLIATANKPKNPLNLELYI